MHTSSDYLDHAYRAETSAASAPTAQMREQFAALAEWWRRHAAFAANDEARRAIYPQTPEWPTLI